MANRKGELRDEGRYTSFGVSDALLITTMYIIGLPVHVHATDGSVYSGIFHTASLDDDYAIVLKKARMIKKGRLDANVVKGTLIETLVIRAEDLVQVVAKEVPLPCNGITGYIGGNGIDAAAGFSERLDRDGRVVKPNERKGKKMHKSQSRFSARREKGFPYSSTAQTGKLLGTSSEDHIERLDTMNFVKIEAAHNSSVDGRQARDGSQERQSVSHDNPEFQDKRTTNETQGSSLSSEFTSCSSIITNYEEPKGVSSGGTNALGDQDQDRPTSNETKCAVASPKNMSVASIPIVDVKSESFLSASSNTFLWIPPKSSSVKGTAKESKLNPGAKIYSPSMLQHQTVTPPAVPNGASVAYMPTYTTASMATALEEVNASVPVKFVPYNNVAIGHSGNGAQYIQPIIGQVMNRTQPVRYSGQYQNFQTGTAYVHPNLQNVMYGRVGPLVCMHPISSDVQSAIGLSPATTRPLITPHQVHLPKHQGNASAQALQLYMAPPIMANGPQPFVMPNSIPISQPVFPVLRPVAVPGSNGFLSTKFA